MTQKEERQQQKSNNNNINYLLGRLSLRNSSKITWTNCDIVVVSSLKKLHDISKNLGGQVSSFWVSEHSLLVLNYDMACSRSRNKIIQQILNKSLDINKDTQLIYISQSIRPRLHYTLKTVRYFKIAKVNFVLNSIVHPSAHAKSARFGQISAFCFYVNAAFRNQII